MCELFYYYIKVNGSYLNSLSCNSSSYNIVLLFLKLTISWVHHSIWSSTYIVLYIYQAVWGFLWDIPWNMNSIASITKTTNGEMNESKFRNPQKERKKEATLVSSMRAQRIWVLCMATLRLSRVSWWYSWVPWEKLKRATFMPAIRSFSSMGTDRDAGPSVHTIFVFGIRPSLGSSFKIPSMSMLDIF